MSKFINLGEAWGGNNPDDLKSDRQEATFDNMRMLIPDDVRDSEMSCGGRQALHESLSRIKLIENRVELCGRCAVIGCSLRII